MKYSVFITTYASKQIRKLDRQYHAQIGQAIRSLGENPRPSGYIKLTNRNAYRIRTGDFRIIYEIEDKFVRVIVVDVGHRKDIYD